MSIQFKIDAKKKILTLLMLGGVSYAAHGQELPEAPHPMVKTVVSSPIKRDFHLYMHSKTSRFLLASDFGVRLLDAQSTRSFMTNACHCIHETELGPIAGSTPGMYAYSFAAASTIEFTAYKLWQHGHPKLGRTLQVVAIVGDGYSVAGNYRTIAKYGK